MRRLAPLFFLGCMLAAPAQAAIIDFTIDLDAAQSLATGEAAPGSTGSGTGTAQLDTDTGIVSYAITWSGTQGTELFSHFHGASGPGLTSPARYFLSAPSEGTLSGSIMLTDPVGTGSAYAIADQIADLSAGLWYVNVHTSHSPSGEIRGQILPTPEPGVAALFALAALGVAAARRRQAR